MGRDKARIPVDRISPGRGQVEGEPEPPSQAENGEEVAGAAMTPLERLAQRLEVLTACPSSLEVLSWAAARERLDLECEEGARSARSLCVLALGAHALETVRGGIKPTRDAVAAFALRNCRETDLVAVHPSDAVLVILLGENINGGTCVATRLLDAWQTEASALRSGSVLNIGATALGEYTLDSEVLIDQALDALESSAASAARCFSHFGSTELDVVHVLRPLQHLTEIRLGFPQLRRFLRHEGMRTALAHLQRVGERFQWLNVKESWKVAEHALRLANRMAIPNSDQLEIGLAAVLHDTGMARVPAPVLNQLGPLEFQHRCLIEAHPADSVQEGRPLALPSGVSRAILHHHERFDGLGYPHRLKGGQIPIAARLLGVADALVAMQHKRAWREPMSQAAALDQIEKGSGTQFDPEIVKTLLRS